MDEDDRTRRRSPSAGLTISRTPTPQELAHVLAKLNDSINKRLEYVEQAADQSLLPFIRETGAKYDEVASGLASVTSSVAALAKSIDTLRADILRQIDDHDERILTIEDRTARHHVRLDTLDETIVDLEARVRPLEQHQAGDARELSLTRSQRRRLDARAGVISTVAGGLAALLSHLLGG